LTTDKHPAYRKAIRWIVGRKVLRRQNQYLNNRMEQNHRPIKQRYYPMLANARLRPIRVSQPFLHSLRRTEPLLENPAATRRKRLFLGQAPDIQQQMVGLDDGSRCLTSNLSAWTDLPFCQESPEIRKNHRGRKRRAFAVGSAAPNRG